MNIPVKNQNGDTVETIQLDDAVFNVPMNHALVHQALVIYQTNKRQGTHSTKTRAQVSGGGRKPWTQKHTGRARQGSIRSPQWRHGGVVFGPHPRDHRKALPRRMRRLALKCVLSEKARQDSLICLESMDAVDGKTKSMAELLQKLQVSGSALVVTRNAEENVVRASHNLDKIWTLPVTLLNAHELLRRETVIMTVAAARWAEEFLSAVPGRRGKIRKEETVVVVDRAEAAVEHHPAAEAAASELEASAGMPGEVEAVTGEQPTPGDVVDQAEASVASPEEDQDNAEEQSAPEDVITETEAPIALSVEDVDGAEEEKE
jgi:large subunit ribosomal protein L4